MWESYNVMDTVCLQYVVVLEAVTNDEHDIRNAPIQIVPVYTTPCTFLYHVNNNLVTVLVLQHFGLLDE
jgi:hypothetical protein